MCVGVGVCVGVGGCVCVCVCVCVYACARTLMLMQSDGMLGAQVLQNPRKVDELIQQV